MRATTAIGFDRGDTLLTYTNTPLNWAALYPAALGSVARRLKAAPTPAQLNDAGHILARYNTRLHPRTREIAAGEIFREVLAAWRLPPNPAHAALEAFFGFFQQRMTPYPETLSVLRDLRALGARLGVLTDVPYGMPRALVERDLAGANLTALVDELLTSVEVGWRKPEPAGFRALAAKLGVAANELWLVGNEEKDIAGALTAGARAVLVDRENRRPNWGQAHTIRRLSELPVMLSP
jgi:putative hydrolase of the HAD superfamily